MTEWGMIIFIVLAGLGSIIFLRRQQKAKWQDNCRYRFIQGEVKYLALFYCHFKELAGSIFFQLPL
jgi:hypothetical protein